MKVVECPTCRGHGRAIRGYDNQGRPSYGGDCGRCGRSGFVPVVDGQPSYPFGKDKDHPALVKPVPVIHKQGDLL